MVAYVHKLLTPSESDPNVLPGEVALECVCTLYTTIGNQLEQELRNNGKRDQHLEPYLSRLRRMAINRKISPRVQAIIDKTMEDNGWQSREMQDLNELNTIDRIINRQTEEIRRIDGESETEESQTSDDEKLGQLIQYTREKLIKLQTEQLSITRLTEILCGILVNRHIQVSQDIDQVSPIITYDNEVRSYPYNELPFGSNYPDNYHLLPNMQSSRGYRGGPVRRGRGRYPSAFGSSSYHMRRQWSDNDRKNCEGDGIFDGEFDRKSRSIIDEFQDIDDARQSIYELCTDRCVSRFVTNAINSSMETSKEKRLLTARILGDLVTERVIKCKAIADG